jgi:hypothetical protein
MSVILNQSLLTLSVPTSTSLAGATVTRIYYRKPDRVTTGFWTGTVNGQSLQYQLTTGDLDQLGVWELESYVVIGGLLALGAIEKFVVEENLLAA